MVFGESDFAAPAPGEVRPPQIRRNEPWSDYPDFRTRYFLDGAGLRDRSDHPAPSAAGPTRRDMKLRTSDQSSKHFSDIMKHRKSRTIRSRESRADIEPWSEGTRVDFVDMPRPFRAVSHTVPPRAFHRGSNPGNSARENRNSSSRIAANRHFHAPRSNVANKASQTVNSLKPLPLWVPTL